MTHTYHDCIQTHPTSGVGGESFTCSECGKRYVLVVDQPRYWEQEDRYLWQRLQTEIALHMTQARTEPGVTLKQAAEKCFEALGLLASVRVARLLNNNQQQEAHIYSQMLEDLHQDVKLLAEELEKKKDK